MEQVDIGLDYAAVPIEGLYRELLAAGGSIPIGKEAWGDHVTEHDFWALVGIPEETVKYDDETIISARFVVAPISPADEPPTALQKAKNQFYARLADDSNSFIQNIDGMSGGPIFALKKVNGDWKYAIIGVQSAWYLPSRILAACPFTAFGQVLEDVVRETRSIQHIL